MVKLTTDLPPGILGVFEPEHSITNSSVPFSAASCLCRITRVGDKVIITVPLVTGLQDDPVIIPPDFTMGTFNTLSFQEEACYITIDEIHQTLTHQFPQYL